MQFLVSETFVLLFGYATAQFFVTTPGHIRWSAVIPCILGSLASFALMLTTRCDACEHPVGRDGKRLVAVPSTRCEHCGGSLA